ncbi:MAG: nicotinamidase [Opitutaceae bacterium]|nr:nicotinamidase [Opitutaceae bacterium]
MPKHTPAAKPVATSAITPAAKPAAKPAVALIVVDVQRDFMTGGALAVPLAGENLPAPERILPRVNALMAGGGYARVVLTQDFHPAGHCSFASTLGVPPYAKGKTAAGREQVAWPEHCVAGTAGAEFHPGLYARYADAIIRKGVHPDCDSYSGFADDGGAQTGLAGYLRNAGITDVDVAGIATDFCVKATALHARANGFATRVLLDACAGVAAASIDAAIAELRAAGVAVVVD